MATEIERVDKNLILAVLADISAKKIDNFTYDTASHNTDVLSMRHRLIDKDFRPTKRNLDRLKEILDAMRPMKRAKKDPGKKEIPIMEKTGMVRIGDIKNLDPKPIEPVIVPYKLEPQGKPLLTQEEVQSLTEDTTAKEIHVDGRFPDPKPSTEQTTIRQIMNGFIVTTEGDEYYCHDIPTAAKLLQGIYA